MEKKLSTELYVYIQVPSSSESRDSIEKLQEGNENVEEVTNYFKVRSSQDYIDNTHMYLQIPPIDESENWADIPEENKQPEVMNKLKKFAFWQWHK